MSVRSERAFFRVCLVCPEEDVHERLLRLALGLPAGAPVRSSPLRDCPNGVAIVHALVATCDDFVARNVHLWSVHVPEDATVLPGYAQMPDAYLLVLPVRGDRRAYARRWVRPLIEKGRPLVLVRVLEAAASALGAVASLPRPASPPAESPDDKLVQRCTDTIDFAREGRAALLRILSKVVSNAADAEIKILSLRTAQSVHEEPGELRVKLLSDAARAPERASEGAAGYDLFAAHPAELPARGRALVKTDVAVAVPPGYYGRIASRSSLAWKRGVEVGAGVVDSDYRGAVGVVLHNHSDEAVALAAGDRVAQLILERVACPPVRACAELDDTARGEGGFGSTGK